MALLAAIRATDCESGVYHLLSRRSRRSNYDTAQTQNHSYHATFRTRI